MIKQLPPCVKNYLLQLFNKFFSDIFFTNQWNLSIIVHIQKPSKDHCNPSNYRPISLTSCLCKLFEQLINDRILDELETNNSLTNIQCGCKKHRSTIDHPVRLEGAIRKSFADREHFISIFFYLERAYDTTWLGRMLRDLRNMGRVSDHYRL